MARMGGPAMRGAAQSAKDSGHRGDAADELAAMKQVLGMSLSAVRHFDVSCALARLFM